MQKTHIFNVKTISHGKSMEMDRFYPIVYRGYIVCSNQQDTKVHKKRLL